MLLASCVWSLFRYGADVDICSSWDLKRSIIGTNGNNISITRGKVSFGVHKSIKFRSRKFSFTSNKLSAIWICGRIGRIHYSGNQYFYDRRNRFVFGGNI